MSVKTTTQKRNYGTDFSKWLREQPSIDSHNEHMSITNLDYVIEGPSKGRKFYSQWSHKIVEGKGLWMLIEEKTHGYPLRDWQLRSYLRIDKLLAADPEYMGFHFLKFENCSPCDGMIWLDDKEITTSVLVQFLRFEADKSLYKSYQRCF
jgi:hypothetical protein